MLSSDIILGLYVNHPVELLLQNGQLRRGEMTAYNSAAGTLCLSGESVSVSELADIRYCGSVAPAFHKSSADEYLVDSSYRFTLANLEDAAAAQLFLYDEFAFSVTCHIYLGENGLCAKDVRIVSTRYIGNCDKEENADFLCRVGGVYVRAGRENGQFISQQGDVIGADDITALTRCPRNNARVIAILENGGSISGTVCASTASGINIATAEGSVEWVSFESLQQLRYISTLSTFNTDRNLFYVDPMYWGSIPLHIRDKETLPFFSRLAEVSFVVGYSLRGPIAKDVALCGELPQVEEHYGIIQKVYFDSESGEPSGVSIGSSFAAPCLEERVPVCAKYNAKPDFRISFDTGYIVKYRAFRKNAADERLTVVGMELVRSFDSVRAGRVAVDDSGTVTETPLFRAAAKLYQDQELELQLKDGSSRFGRLTAYDENSATLTAQNGSTLAVPFDSVAEARIFGTVTWYSAESAAGANGTGYINNNYFFHIDKLLHSADVEHIRKGCMASFALGNSRKGTTHITCLDIAIIGEEKRSVYVLEYADGVYTVVDEDAFSAENPADISHAYQLPYSGFNQFRDLKNRAYLAIVTVALHPEQPRCIRIQAITAIPKNVQHGDGEAAEAAPVVTSGPFVGYLVRANYRGEFGFITPEEYFDTASLLPLPDTSQYNVYFYSRTNALPADTVQQLSGGAALKLRYYVATQTDTNRSVATGITLLDTLQPPAPLRRGPFVGYLTAFNHKGTFGFICPEAYFDTERLQPTADSSRENNVFFDYRKAQNAPAAFEQELLRGAVYKLQYYQAETHHLGKAAPASDVSFTEKLLPSAAQADSAPAAQQTGPMPWVTGETVLVQHAEGSYTAAKVARAAGSSVWLQGHTQSYTEQELIRFGVLTDCADLSEGRINNAVSFSFALAEKRTYNIIKTSPKKMPLIYRYAGGAVTYAERITGELLAQIANLQWFLATCTAYTADAAADLILVNGSIRYYKTVSTAGAVARLASSGALTGTQLYCKAVNCPIYEDGVFTLGEIALDLHLQRESAEIRFDRIANRYLAARGATKAIPVDGPPARLALAVGSKAEILFSIAADGVILTAAADEASLPLPDTAALTPDLPDEPDDRFTASSATRMEETALVQTLYRSINWKKLPALSADGLAPDFSQTELLRLNKLYKNGGPFAERIAVCRLLQQAKPVIRTPQKELLQVRSVVVDGARDMLRSSNPVMGAYSYYLAAAINDTADKKSRLMLLSALLAPDFLAGSERDEAVSNRDKTPALSALLAAPALSADGFARHLLMLSDSAWEDLRPLLDASEPLSRQILDRSYLLGRQWYSEDYNEKASDRIRTLRRSYRNARKLVEKDLIGAAAAAQSRPIDCITHIAEKLGAQSSSLADFLSLVEPEDKDRFSELRYICMDVCANRSNSYLRRTESLENALYSIRALIATCTAELTKETTELLLQTDVLQCVKTAIEAELRALYEDESRQPEITVEANEYSLFAGQQTLPLLVSNSRHNSNRQTATDVFITLESLGGLPADYVNGSYALPAPLKAGDAEQLIHAEADLSALEGSSLTLGVSAGYSFICGLDENGMPIKKTVETDCGTLTFQLADTESLADKSGLAGKDPYKAASRGQALEAGEPVFFGRRKEIAQLYKALVKEDGTVNRKSVAVLYGQKKGGKTSLMNQITDMLERGEGLRQEAVIISCSTPPLPDTDSVSFFGVFYSGILSELRHTLRRYHKALFAEMRENGLDIDAYRDKIAQNSDAAASLFKEFISDFYDLAGDRCSLILIIDEYTWLTSYISRDLDNRRHLLNYIRTFSQDLGIAQVIIGHYNMVLAFEALGVLNQTVAFAERVELTSLEEADAIDLIKKPMADAAGTDVYATALGERAVQRLLRLSGCHPHIITQLCSALFEHYLTTPQRSIYVKDVEDMLQQYLQGNDIKASYFDFMIHEDGDNQNTAYLEGHPNYLYLKMAAQHCMRSETGDCDESLLCEELEMMESPQDRTDAVKNTLAKRHIIDIRNGRVSIRTGLFTEYIRMRHGDRN